MHSKLTAAFCLLFLLAAGCAGHNNAVKTGSRDYWDDRPDEFTISYDESGIPAKTANRLAEAIDQAISQIEDPHRVILNLTVDGKSYQTLFVIMDREEYLLYKVLVFENEKKLVMLFMKKVVPGQ